MNRIAITTARTLLAVAALTLLEACAGGNSSADLSPAAPQQAEAPPPEPAPAPKQAARPAGRNVAAPPAPSPTPAPAQQAALTPEEVKAQCWMKYENDKKVKNIDARLQLVEKCVNETSRNQPPAR